MRGVVRAYLRRLPGPATVHVLRRQFEPFGDSRFEQMACLSVSHLYNLRAYTTENVPADTLVIHSKNDDTVPLANALEWARPQTLPLVLVRCLGHFFHGKRQVIRQMMSRAFRA